MNADFSEKIIIVDDYDKIDPSKVKKERFLNYIETVYCSRIILKNSKNNLDILTRFEEEKTSSESLHYQIKHFYGQRRKSLIEKSLRYLYTNEEDIEDLVESIDTSLKHQKSYFGFEPEFIKDFSLYFCNNKPKKSYKHDSSIYSIVFENGLTSQISKYSEGFNLDIFYILASEVAYTSFIEKLPITLGLIERVVGLFNNKMDEQVSSAKFIAIATSSKLIIDNKNSNDCNKMKFSSRDQYAYFIAKKISSAYKDDSQIKSAIKVVVKNSYDNFYSSILMFLTYLNRDIGIMETVLSELINYTRDWTEFTFENQIPFLRNTDGILKINRKNPTQSQKDLKRKQQELREKQISDQVIRLDDLDINEFPDDKTLTFIEEMRRSISLLDSISRVLPNFHYMLDRDAKEKFTKTIYEIPNKIFNVWASFINDNIDDFIKVFSSLLENSDPKTIKKTRDEYNIRAMTFITNFALITYLNIVASPVMMSTNSDTIRHLEKYKDNQKDSNSLMYLLMLEKMRDTSKFVNLVKEIENRSSNFNTRILANRITQHYLLNNEKLSNKDVKYITDTLFGTGKTSPYFSANQIDKSSMISKAKSKGNR